MVNLFEVGCGERVVEYFNELIAGPGAVRATLHRRRTNEETDF